MKTFVISLGGSVINEFLQSPEKLKKYVEILDSFAEKGFRFVIITGGGKVAREYIKLASNFTQNKNDLDKIGIEATRLNARLLISSLKNCYPEPISTVNELLKSFDQSYSFFIGCGNQPGCSTDFNSVLFAEAIGCKVVINISDVSGIYDKDPKKFDDAKKIDKLSYDEFFELIKSQKAEPGTYELFDLSALRIAKRSKIKLIFIGSNPNELEKVLKGEKVGSEVYG